LTYNFVLIEQSSNHSDSDQDGCGNGSGSGDSLHAFYSIFSAIALSAALVLLFTCSVVSEKVLSIITLS